MFVYSWGQNVVWKELIIDGKSRMLLIRYKYFSIMFIFMAAHSKSYFLQNEDQNLDLSNPNLFTDGSLMEISPEKLRAINNGKLVSVGWWKNWSLLLIIWIIIVGVIIGSYSKPNAPLTPKNTLQSKKNEAVITDNLVDSTQKLVGVKGVEFVDSIWGLEEINDYLSSNGTGKYSTEDVAFVYTKTTQVIFDQFIEDIAKNRTETQLEKSIKFQKAARETGIFIKNFPTALASYQNNQESIKNYFFSDTQKLNKITFTQFRLAIDRTKEMGAKKDNKYTISSFGQVFELTLNPRDESQIVSFQMLDKSEKNKDAIAL